MSRPLAAVRRILRAAALVVLAAAAAAPALADGGVFSEPPKVVDAVVRPVRTPDQRALLAFDGETETLVIETTVQGDGTNFAWVLPLPAAPEIEASTTGLFPTLEAMTGPGLWVDATPWWMAILWLGWLLRIIVRPGRGRLRPRMEIAALIVSGLVAWVWIETPRMSLNYGDGAELTFGKYGGDAGAAAPEPLRVEVLARATVGVLDTAVVRAERAADLRTWLEGNGFHADADVDPVLAQYVAEGWVFVASKVRADAPSDAVRRIHPLAFRFPAKSPVYPMRLTGATNDSLVLDLWVFAEDGAACARMDRTFATGFRAWSVPPVNAWTGHEELRRRAGGARGVTRLTGTFDRAAMSRDLTITWGPLDDDRTLVYTPAAAATFAADGAAAVVAIGMVVGAALLPRPRGRRRRGTATTTASESSEGAAARGAGARVGFGTMVFAVATFAFVWAVLPQAPAGTRVAAEFDDRSYEIGRLLDEMPCYAHVADARAWLAPRLARFTNPWTGTPLREEDSPGNYVIEERDGAVWFRRFWDTGPLGSARGLCRFGTPPDTPGFVTRARSATGPTVRVRGQVLDTRGTPVAGAMVRLGRAWTAEEASHAVRDDWLREISGEDGRFEAVLPAGFFCDIEVAGARHPLLVRSAVDLRAEPTAPLVLVVPESVPLRGRVVDARGSPVAGAIVHLLPAEGWRPDGPASATTAADGTFTFHGLAAGTSSVQVEVHVHGPGLACPHATFDMTPGAASRDLSVTLAR